MYEIIVPKFIIHNTIIQEEGESDRYRYLGSLVPVVARPTVPFTTSTAPPTPGATCHP
jgi:hypothetical protein